MPEQMSGWTRHGHRIDGMVQIGKPELVARCGGPGLCAKCSVEAASRTAAMTPQHPAAPETETCNWPRCHGRPNPCFAWCKCRCHRKSSTVAPETETDASGLTEAVTFAPMRPAPIEEAWPLGDQDGYAIRLCTCEEGAYLGARLGGTPCRCERCGFITLDQWEYIVERIVAERVRVVEGERDAAQEQGTRLADGLYRWRDDAERYLARAESAEAEVARLQAVVNQGAAGAVCPDLRTHGERVHRIVAEAESAEAAHEAEKAAHERRVKRAEALLDAWEHDAPGLVDPVFAGRLREVLRRDPAPVRLRGDDALGGGGAR